MPEKHIQIKCHFCNKTLLVRDKDKWTWMDGPHKMKIAACISHHGVESQQK